MDIFPHCSPVPGGCALPSLVPSGVTHQQYPVEPRHCLARYIPCAVHCGRYTPSRICSKWRRHAGTATPLPIKIQKVNSACILFKCLAINSLKCNGVTLCVCHSLYFPECQLASAIYVPKITHPPLANLTGNSR